MPLIPALRLATPRIRNNRTTYENILSGLNTALQTIHNALKQAGSDAHQIAKILKDK
jgi:hypothetical protein